MKEDDFLNCVRESLHPDFLCHANIVAGGVVEHREDHGSGKESIFRLRLSRKGLVFSLDKQGRNPFEIIAPGMNNRNDLTVLCFGDKSTPLVFVIECKNSGSPLTAQKQIDCGVAFVEYLFKLVKIQHGTGIHPKVYGVAAYRPASPPKGTTRPKFVKTGKSGLMRANWSIAVELPLLELVRAAGHA